MRAVIQRVINASVVVDGQTISSIGKGLLVLVGIDRYDEPSDASQIIKKILTARLFDDDTGSMWKKSVKDIDGEVLCVSQFTLLAKFKASTKPDFHESMSTIPGKAFYTTFMDDLKKAYHPNKIKDGQFGAMMQVSLTNDGPVTILLDSKSSASSSSSKSTPSTSRSITPGPSSNTMSQASTKSKTKKNKSQDQSQSLDQSSQTDQSHGVKDPSNNNAQNTGNTTQPSSLPNNGSVNRDLDKNVTTSLSSLSGTVAQLGLGTSSSVVPKDA
ncbi:D-tyrosyl-tRNA(Tyr) deacylase [Kwoniella dejecticola CBS 10117]|uniref:D-aminoacyl-tRNA deacylase n=1 Tax=Kwoniella dejecticola CBS 10117 TaxID=1296121 RepID=A0A1A6A7L0_9TREE|nr:D-tyrosyl-tRNA(Tyr) deacylase [Kwoniella dejecticola CBS 10117]OBR86042.1 D-tyrosyl-tRNA(Tyr) deacylase [Kwoniella dejecticola CBS 10117]